MASSARSSMMGIKVENGKNGGEPMEVQDKAQHVQGADQNDSDEEYHEPGMRVGSEYQAVIPDLASDDQDENSKHNALLVWAPAKDIPDSKLEEYLRTAKDKHGYNVEQALGMLFWHKHNVDKSLNDLSNFTPFPDEWSMEDKVLFEQAFGSHGKSFKRIQQMLPDKAVSSLVKYYYSWKKTRSRTSLIDRQARRLAVKEYIDNSDTSDSDFDPDKEQSQANGQIKPKTPTKQPVNQPLLLASTCCNIHCGAQSQHIQSTPKGNLCTACYHYWKRTGAMRQPRMGGRDERTGPRGNKLKRKPPKGMNLSHDSLMSISYTHGDAHIKPLDNEIDNLKRQIQANKQIISLNKYQMEVGIDDFRLGDLNNKNNARWTDKELLLAVQSVRKYGKDFQAMAEVVGNKTISQCRNFFVNYRRRYNLQEVLEEYEAEQGITSSDKKDSEMISSHMTGSPGLTSSPGPQTSSPPISSQGIPCQPPPLLKPSGAQPQRSQPPPLQSQSVSRVSQSGSPLQGPPPLIKPAGRPSMQSQEFGRAMAP
ncbi:REST corepressor 3-like isoform X2 [Actinia tenebrosa]|uniref:REST corepressor 3-like isoform X2 n=1 Tax=Actinia tenebrosa TaxID=6105 RepID=A0A6P8HCP0_ACTTE|nr:REST corepressor 3-like isoform X2 [Actinia tenebrosa]